MWQPKQTMEMPVGGKRGNDKTVSHPSHQPWKSIKPISTFPPSRRLRRDELISKTEYLRATHSDGKLRSHVHNGYVHLVEHQELALVDAVEGGRLPISVAAQIASGKDAEISEA